MVKNKKKINYEKNHIITQCDKCGTDMTRKESKLWVNNDEVYVMHDYCLPRKIRIERGLIEVKE